MNSSYTSFDSEFCGSLPLHLINQIQPHGILMILDNKNLNIIQVSENVGSFLGIKPQDILKKPLADFIAAEDFKNLKNKLNKWANRSRLSINLSFIHEEKQLDLITFITPSESYTILEIEYKISDNSTFFDVYHEVKYLIASLTNASDLQEIAKIAAIETKSLSGFDKVMIYKFDEKWNGTVIAEAKEEEMDSYLHLRFPASDIPNKHGNCIIKYP